MIRHLKSGRSVAARAQINTQVKSTVEGIIADIEERGDAAVLEYSRKFDHWQPAALRLSAEQIGGCIAALCSRLCALEHLPGHREQADIRVRRLKAS